MLSFTSRVRRNNHSAGREGGCLRVTRPWTTQEAIEYSMSETDKLVNTGQVLVDDTDSSEIEYVDASELSPIGNEKEFAREIGRMVAEEAPRLFALCEELGDRADAVTVAWGMSFDDFAEVVSAAHDGVRGIFSSAERARKRLSSGEKIKIRLVWVDEAQNQNSLARLYGRV